MFAKIKNYKAFLMKLCPNIPQDYIFKALRFYQVLLKLCKKITQDSEPCVFDQIFLRLCPIIPQDYKPCVLIKFCSNFAQKFHKTTALRFYQTHVVSFLQN